MASKYKKKRVAIARAMIAEPKILYKDINKKQKLEVRYSTSITGDDMKKLLADPDNTQIGLSLKDNTKLFTSKDFSQKLFETGIIINE